MKKKFHFKLSTTQTILLSFFLAILVGSVLLALPISSANGTAVPYIDALFTATTSICVTGLVTLPTVSTWSLFGQVVILILIQIGGLGVVTMDASYQKKPFGGWGELYIMDCPSKDFTDQIENPYGDGILYKTGHTARITPAGNVEFLEHAGRTVMIETVKGRDFVDLHQIEKALCGYEGVSKASAYTYYGEDNAIHIGADICGIRDEDIQAVKEYMAGQIKETWIPERIVCEL